MFVLFLDEHIFEKSCEDTFLVMRLRKTHTRRLFDLLQTDLYIQIYPIDNILPCLCCPSPILSHIQAFPVSFEGLGNQRVDTHNQFRAYILYMYIYIYSCIYIYNTHFSWIWTWTKVFSAHDFQYGCNFHGSQQAVLFLFINQVKVWGDISMHHNRLYNKIEETRAEKAWIQRSVVGGHLVFIEFSSRYIPVHLQNLIGTRAISISVYLINQIDFNQNIPSLDQL